MKLIIGEYAIVTGGIDLLLTVDKPEPGQPVEYNVRLTDDEIKNATTPQALQVLVVTRVNRQIHATSIGARLGPLLGAVLTV